MAKKTLVSFLLDETGSMGVCRDTTISAFNEYVQSLRNDPDSRFRFTLVKFNSNHVTTVCNGAKLSDVPELNHENYVPDVTTPLYDAVAQIISDTEKAAEKNKVIVVILTDGQENASKEHTYQSVAEIIKRKQDEGWAFVFLGANQDAWTAAAQIGISRACAATFSQQDMIGTVRTVYRATSGYAKGASRSSNVMENFTNEDGTIKTS